MNDANLNVSADARQDLSTEVVRIVERLTPELGDLTGSVSPLEGGITNRNYRATMGGIEYVIRVPGKDTNLLEIDRRAEVLANERAASLGVAPPVAAALTDPPAIVTEFVEGEGMSSEDLREPEPMERIAASLKRIHDSKGTIPTDFNSFRIVETYARHRG